MNLVQPIKDVDLIDKLKTELLKKDSKDCLLFDIAINIGLRITDIINLTVWDVKNKSEIVVKEERSSEPTSFLISPEIRDEIEKYTLGMTGGELLFASKKGGKRSVTSKQAYKALNEIGHKLGMDNIGVHTLRKTFGYHHYLKHNDIALLQKIFSHSNSDMTLRYIGINDMKELTIEDFFL